tara:strand:+ start:7576 stop:7947 length:372 start_codon:yes stop_codon:yes gene_type:complete
MNKKLKLNFSGIINKVESDYLKINIPQIYIGDTVRFGIEIVEGQKVRVQGYEGVVIAKKNTGINKMLTVRRVMQGIGIERSILINSPKIKTIKIIRSAKVRRSKLYYLRNRFGKSARLKTSIK